MSAIASPHQKPRAAAGRSSARRHDIDWLRVFAVLLLIPFHTARIFDSWEPFYVKSGETSLTLSLVVIRLVGAWHMPLLFLLAGASTRLALGARTAGQYVAERLQRLLVPFLFGVLAVVPPQAYVARFQQAGYAQSYLEFLPDYFRARGDLSGYTGLFTPGHLWFILFLLVFSLAAVPLFRWLDGAAGRTWVSRLAASSERRGALLVLLALSLMAAGALPAIGGKNPFYYGLLFVCGYVLMADERFERAIQRDRWLALGLGIATTLIPMSLFAARVQLPGHPLGYAAFGFLRHLETAAWLVALLGMGRRFLHFTTPVLRYANEASYPFYILHQTVIVIVGYYVVAQNMNLMAKFALICALSFIATLGLYDVLVKRFGVLRRLFGMRLQNVGQPAAELSTSPMRTA